MRSRCGHRSQPQSVKVSPDASGHPLTVCRFATAALLAVCSAFSAGAAPPTQPPRLLKVVNYPAQSSTRIVLHFSSPAEFQIGSAGRLRVGASRAVRFPGVRSSGRGVTAQDGLVERIQTVAAPQGLDLLLTVSEPSAVNVFFLPDPYRVVVDVVSEARETGLGRRSVSRVALDAGHGGEDPGAMSEWGLAEKDVALDIVLRAAPLLARELGVTTLLTRNTDERIALEERVAKANAFGADLFLSVHCNADRARKAHGYMSFVLDGSGVHSTATPPEEGGTDRRYLRQFGAFGKWGLALQQSRRFASLVQKATAATLHQNYPDARDGGVHGAGFYVLAGATMPAVLFESSFISHPVESERLAQPHYRQKLADGIVNAVRAFQAGL